jgi:hypothetical protein
VKRALLVLALFLLFLLPFPASGKITTPTSLFYGAKITFEHIQLAFTFGDEAKAIAILGKADERISEIEALFLENRTEKTGPVEREYSFLINTYSQLPKSARVEGRFGKHVEKIDSLENSIGLSSGAPERQKIYFIVVLSSMRSQAATVGVVPLSKQESLSERILAERAVEDAAGEIASFAKLNPEKSPDALIANETLSSARKLLESRDYIAARAIAEGVAQNIRSLRIALNQTETPR